MKTTPFFLLSSIFLSPMTPAAAWLPQRTLPAPSSRTTTALSMFDWFHKGNNNNNNEDKGKNDLFGNLFSPPKTTESVPPEPEATMEEPAVTEPVASTELTPVEAPAVVVGSKQTAHQESPASSSLSSSSSSDEEEEEVHSGQVLWFDRKRGYGMIQDQSSSSSSENDHNVFVHHSEIQAPGFRYLLKGESVEFHVQHDAAGRELAKSVKAAKGKELKMTKYNKNAGVAADNK